MDLFSAHQSSTTPAGDHAGATGLAERRCVLFGCLEAAAWIISDPKAASCPPARPTWTCCSTTPFRVPPDSRVRVEV